MAIHLNDTLNKDKFACQHYTRFRSAEGLEMFTLTGNVIMDWKSESSKEWRQETEVYFAITVPGLAENEALELEYWAPFLSLNAISNDGMSNWAGWAIESFGILNPRALVHPQVMVEAEFAGRDTDSWILRVGYHVQLGGRIVPYQD